MGQTLSEPIVEKHTTEGGDKRLKWAATENAHTTINQLSPNESKHISFFAVYDGHGGTHAAKYSGQNLHQNVVSSVDFEQGEYQKALKNGFLKTDENLRKGICY
jgi:protein phosphatase 2C family protein 2/3